MDEIKQMLSLVLEKVNTINEGLDEVKQRLDRVEERLDRVEERLDRVEQRLDVLEKRVDKLEVETTKNSVMLEDLKRKLELMAEIQESYMQQNAREHEELKKYIDDRISIVELAV